MSPPTGAATVLLVEDNPGDARLVREALATAPLDIELHAVTNGTVALDLLQRAGSSHPAVRPDLVLLDLNLPGISGFEVLERIRSDPDLADLTVVVFTSSDAASDMSRSTRLGADDYVTKPADLDRFLDVVVEIVTTWTQDAGTRPPSDPSG